MEYGKYCPNKNLPEWKEMVEAVGENRAYYLWMQNKGNSLDKAPNGNESKLFKDLLDLNKGDRNKTIQDKSVVYTPEFSTEFLNLELDSNEEVTIDSYKQNTPVLPLTKDKKININTRTVIIDSGSFIKARHRDFINDPDIPRALVNLFQDSNIEMRIEYLENGVEGDPNIYMAYNQDEDYILINSKKWNQQDLKYNIESVIHEIVHAYTVRLLNIYQNNPELLSESDRQSVKQIVDLYEEVKKLFRNYSPVQSLYGLQSVQEFVAELFVNKSFDKLLQKNIKVFESRKRLSTNKYRNFIFKLQNAINRILNAICDFILSKLDKKREVNLQELDEVKKSILRILNNNIYGGRSVINKLYESINASEDTTLYHREMQPVVDKTYSKIQQGLKNRLESIKRYSTKNPKVWRQLQLLIQQLSNSEAEEGILQFIEHINDTINDSIQFLNRPIEEINAKQIRQLAKDYVGFYKPMMDEIQYLLDTTDIFNSLDNYAQIVENFNTLSRQMDRVNNRFRNVLKSKGYSYLQDFLREQGMPEDIIQETIQWLDDPKHDSSIIMNWFGMASESNNAVIQSIAKLLNDTKNATDRGTMEIGIKLMKTLNVAKQKYGNDVQKLLYERLDDGTYSGYRVQKLNRGQMRKDMKQFLDELVSKLNLERDKDGRIVLPQDEDIQKQYFDALNDWYSKHANRKYKPEYYALRNSMLSMATRDAEQEIQGYIDQIVDPITINGVVYENLLSDSEYEQLIQLRKQKRLLANSYNVDGSIKTGVDAQIAKELQAFNEKVRPNVKYRPDKARYNKDRAAVAKRYGEDSKELKLWEYRNTKQQFTEEFYELLDKVARSSQQSEQYQKIKEIRRQILQLYKDPHTGKIDVDKLSDVEKAQIRDLDEKLAQERIPTEKQEGLQFKDVAEIIFTSQYHRDMEAARQAGTQAYNDWFNANHYEDSRGRMHPASYYTEIRPVNPTHIETAPGDKYTTLDVDSNWYNKDWEEGGPAIQPNKKLYDNSKAYDAVMSKPEVKALYDVIEEVMNEANSFISFLQFSNDNKMPQISARLAQALARKDTLLGKLGYIFEDFATTKEDDLDFIEENSMPNGDPIRVIPTRFIKMLEDPNTISTDAVYAVLQYYNMALNYRNMQSKQDEVELLLSLLKSTRMKTRKGIKQEGSSNVYNQAQLLVDRLMYGRNRQIYEVNVLGNKVNVSKILDIVRYFITKVNLSGNLWSIATSFFTDATYTTLESRLGRFFNKCDFRFARKEFLRQLPNMLENVGNPVPKGKLAYLMLLNQVVKSNQEVFDRLDQSQVLRAINQNFWFAGYTQSDYTVKSHTVLSIYHNYRFVEGIGFLSEQQYIDRFYSQDRNKGRIQFEQLPVTLYDVYEEDAKGDVAVNKRYQEYITDKLLNDVRNRINILSRRIDGTLREVDKAGVHANSLASYIVMHRNFMIQGLTNRFKKKQFNLDLGVIEEGWYRTTGKFLANIIKDRHFALTQLLADYDNLQPYEQYAVDKVAKELMIVAGSTLVAVVMASLVDGDDDYDMWVTQAATYIAMRSAFEFRTMYNPLEFVALIKSPTAAFTWLDNASNFINLFNPFSYFGNRTPFTIIDRGAYEGMPIILRNIIKVTPFRSIFEAQDPKSKRNYLQNQLMNF